MIEQRPILEAFVKLGDFLREYSNTKGQTVGNAKFRQLDDAILLASQQNGWFTKDNIGFALQHWSGQLTIDHLAKWLKPYGIGRNAHKTVAIIMAGNIPLVGFHDFLATLVTGNTAYVKLSSNDRVLLPAIANLLTGFEPLLEDRIRFTQEKMEDFDAVIATGSNNTARYFEHYFDKYPHIIRKNRNSVAVLRGTETPGQLTGLGEDIFRYYGLGCRSVSKLFVPQGYDFDVFFKQIFGFHGIVDHAKYANNYDYNKAVYLMGGYKLLENGFLILKEDLGYASPIASVFYEFYDDLELLKLRLQDDNEFIQCIVSQGVVSSEESFGDTQKPLLWQYADGVDTVDFLLRH